MIIDFRKFRGLPYTDYKQKFEDGGGLEKKFGYPRLVPRVGAGYGSIPTNDDGTINVRARHPFRDRINSTDIWVHEGPWDKTTLGSQARDYIKFRIEAVNTDNPKVDLQDSERFENFSNASEIDLSNDNTIRNINLNQSKDSGSKNNGGITLDI